MKTTLLICIIGAIVLTFLLYLLSFVFKKKGQTRTATFVVFAISILSLSFAGRPLIQSIYDINDVYDKTDKYMDVVVTALAIVDLQIDHEVTRTEAIAVTTALNHIYPKVGKHLESSDLIGKNLSEIAAGPLRDAVEISSWDNFWSSLVWVLALSIIMEVLFCLTMGGQTKQRRKTLSNRMPDASHNKEFRPAPRRIR